MEAEKDTNPTQEGKPAQPASPVPAPTPKTPQVMGILQHSWQTTRHRRSFALATGITSFALILSCILGARPIANSIGLDRSATQPRGNDLITSSGSISLTPTLAPTPTGSG